MAKNTDIEFLRKRLVDLDAGLKRLENDFIATRGARDYVQTMIKELEAPPAKAAASGKPDPRPLPQAPS